MRGRLIVAFSGLLMGTAVAAGGPVCKTFDRAPPCCPHPPPQCCEPQLATPVDDELVTQVCGAATAKGQKKALNMCKRYFARGDDVGEVTFGREAGDDGAFEKLKADMNSGRSKVSPTSVPGAQKAFLTRETDETGALTRSSAWALVGHEIVRVEAERATCDDGQVLMLLTRAIERLQPVGKAARR